MADDIEKTDDELEHAELRDALVTIVDALAKLGREDRVKVLMCVKHFFGLPRGE